MFIVRISGNEKLTIAIEKLSDADYKTITAKKYFFNWRLEKAKACYKLRVIGQTDILGLISLAYFDDEDRVEIRLLAVSAENVGKERLFEGIAGNLIAFAARLAVKEYGANAAISLVPKTLLGQHYMDKYGFEQAGRSLFMAGKSLWNLLKEYGYDR